MTGYRLLPFHCEYYHGKPGSRPYFEGWYFRHCDPAGGFSLAVIPGVSKGLKKDGDHAFIQVLIGPEGRSYYLDFPLQDCSFGERHFAMTVAGNRFSAAGIELDIDKGGLKLKGRLEYSALLPLHTSLFAPSIMGPFAYLPNMQCNHGVLSLYHRVDGQLTIDGRELRLENGCGYIEKDWGREFPSAWLWLQSNKAENGQKPASFSCSIATIPYHGVKFTGLIAVYLKEGREYRFTTYQGAKAGEITLSEQGFSFYLHNRSYKLQVRAFLNKQATLKAPDLSGMKRDILEDTDGRLEIVLYRHDKPLITEVFQHAAIEAAEAQKLCSG